ncbi:MAG: sulfatase [Acidobacteriota bacterium]
MTSRRGFLQQAAVASTQRGRRRPNLVFIFSDQQSRDMMGCYGNSQIQTPRLDSFAAQGVRFEHCVASAPLCTPYRGLLLSGRHTLHNGALSNDIRMLPGEGDYFGEVLRDAGYRTGYIGKWHLYGGNRVRPIPAGPLRYGFDETFLSNNCTVVFDAERAYYWNQAGERTLYGDWEPYAQARQATQFIDDNRDRPFALFLSWHPPHNWASAQETQGYGAPEDVMKLYDPDAIRLRPNCEDVPANRKVYQGHMAMCTSVDRAFGWVLDKLEEHGLAENTLVVFTSDHGDTLRSHGLMFNKMRPEAESIRVPLMIRYPGVLKKRVSELVVGTLDLMPTLLALIGLPVPKTVDGRNLAAAIKSGKDSASESAPLFLLPLDWRGVYTRRYTYCEDVSAGSVAPFRQRYFSKPDGLRWNCLYDRKEDPAELHNLFESPAAGVLAKKLQLQTRQWMRRFGDKGVPYQEVRAKLFEPSDIEAEDAGRLTQVSGILRGRPSEVL